MTDNTDALAALTDLVAAHADKITRLDAGLAGLAARTEALSRAAAAIDAQVAALTSQDGRDGEGYAPAPARRWWKLSGADRDEALAALRGWVEQVYRPGYGQLAASLGGCWEQHPLCLYAVDILAELWSLLYLAGRRTPAILSAQAEYQTRILPALAQQMSAETTGCPHALGALPARIPRRSTP